MKVMNGKIHILEETVANKIAAGEVVERPAAVVKELVENSIDAGANKIGIEIEESGAKLIKVIDNGSGMNKSDAVLSLERHATSKILEADDLFKITTLGFRGEAVPSIAAVSTLEMTTKTANQLAGTYLRVVGGEIKEIREVGCPVGTSIAIHNLFFNTPARLKYLKSPSTEMGHILDMVNHLSLAHPQISFCLTHNSRQIFFSPGTANLLEVIVNIYGTETAKEMLPVKFGSSRVRLTGFIGKPNIARSSRSYMNFFVNGRFIRSRVIGRAVEDAYKSLLPVRKYPIVILNFEIDPEEIDVNVHPTKTEVRFSDERDIYLITQQSISQALRGVQLIPRIEKKSLEEKSKDKETLVNLSLLEKVDNSTENLEKSLAEETERLVSRVKEESTSYQSPYEIKGEEVYRREVTDISRETDKLEEVNNHVAQLPEMEVVGQIHNTFIITQSPEGMFILDQHAAHERILYEKIKSAKAQGKSTIQALLIPISLELTPKEKVIWEELRPILLEVGFEIEDFGGNTYLIRGIPTFVNNQNVLPFIKEIIDDFLNSTQKKMPGEWREKTIITMSCRLAIKAGDSLDNSETKGLLKSLALTNNPYTCPHGRPTLIRFSLRELEENFKRR